MFVHCSEIFQNRKVLKNDSQQTTHANTEKLEDSALQKRKKQLVDEMIAADEENVGEALKDLKQSSARCVVVITPRICLISVVLYSALSTRLSSDSIRRSTSTFDSKQLI